MRKVVLITGSSRGIGKEIATIFAKNNYDIVINYNNSKEEANILKENLINTYNVNVETFKCDISIEDEVKEMVNFVVSKFNRIDCLVNNASICNDSFLEDKTVSDFRRIIDVNLVGTFIVSKYVSVIFKQQGFGNIINISSTNAIDTYYPESMDYDCSKAGVISLTHNFAKELKPLRVNCIVPGWVKTDMNKDLSKEQIEEESKNIYLNRFADAKEIAKVVYFVASDDASYINNSIIRVDGGYDGI